jgi:HAMP domain-containing protein
MSEKESLSKTDSKIVKTLMHIIEEFEQKLNDVEYHVRDAGLRDVMESINMFRGIMEDLRALLVKDVDYFKVRINVWRSKDGLSASASVMGRVLEFTVDDLDPNTPVSKIIDAVLNNEENLFYAASRAFVALSDFARKISEIADVSDKLSRVAREIEWLKKSVNRIVDACRERD